MIDFKDQVAVVTGRGRGLGRLYALELAKRGALVVVNDLGGSMHGDGEDASVADAVVKEIEDAGGRLWRRIIPSTPPKAARRSSTLRSRLSVALTPWSAMPEFSAASRSTNSPMMIGRACCGSTSTVDSTSASPPIG